MMAGTDALARGISQGGKSLGDALSDIGKQHKRESQEAQAYRTILSDVPELKDRVKAMGIGELRGHMQKRTLDEAMRQQEQDRALRQQQIDIQLRRAAMDERNAGALEGFAGAFANAQPGNPTMENYYENGDGTMPRPTPSLSDRIGEGLTKFPAAAASPQFDNTLGAMIAAEERRGANSLFKPEDLGTMRKTDVPGIYYMPTSRGGGQVVTDPTMPQRPNAEKPSDEGTIEIPDPNDPVYGPRIRIPITVARRNYPHLLKTLDAPQTPNQTPNPTQQPAEEAPRDPAKRTKNAVYQTPQGSLRWTGTGWVKP